MQLLVSPDQSQGSLKIHQDARILASVLDAGSKINIPLASGRKYWLQVAQGQLKINQIQLEKGDGVAIEQDQISDLSLEAVEESEFLLFDLRNQI